MAEVLIQKNVLYVSHKWLLSNSYYRISENTIEAWKTRSVGVRIYIQRHPYVLFSSIPAATRKRFPTQEQLIIILKEGQTPTAISQYKDLLLKAIEKDFGKFVGPITKYANPKHDLLLHFAQRAAVLDLLQGLDTKRRGSLEALTTALNEVYPKWISNKCALKNLLKRVKENGLLPVAVDERKTGNTNAAKFGFQVKHKASYYYSSGKAYTAVQAREFLHYDCEANGWPLPSVRTLRNWFVEFQKNAELHQGRYGAKKTFDHLEPFASTIHALNAGDQWQADGLDLPFYTKDYQRHTLFFVVDAHSKKIVGYSIDKSENTQMILRAFDDAVKSTNTLPYEIKMDNHSYNRTIEGQTFRAETETYGVKWTISHNPRHKSIIERLNKTLNERYFKGEKGYIGEGIKSRNKGGHTAPELLSKYQKSGYWLTLDEVVSIAIKVVDAYNNTALKGGKSPNELYAESSKANCIPVTFEGRIRLFTKQTERKVSRGQITIERSGTRYEYQLPADLFGKYNGSTVVVHYEDLGSIYLFDKKSGMFIANLNQKPKIHGALANQTDRDRELLFKHKGRLAGIRAQARKQIEQGAEALAAANPDAHGRLNPLTTPKDVIKEVERQYHLKQRAEDMGLDFTRAEKSLPVDECLVTAFQPKSSTPVKNPFVVKNHQVTVKRAEEYNQ